MKDWQRYRNKYPGSKAEADDKFIALCAKTDPEHPLSVDMLYRRQRALDENDLDGLVNKRGKNRKGKSTITEPMRQAFLYYYLDQSQHPISKCYEYMKLWAQQEAPYIVADIPSYTTFYRMVQNDIPEPIKVGKAIHQYHQGTRDKPSISTNLNRLDHEKTAHGLPGWLADRGR